MSVEAMAAVLHHSPARGTVKLVLLGIANHAGDGGAWPTVATLAKYASCSERQVQRAIQQLAGKGEIRVWPMDGGSRDCPDNLRPNRYDVLTRCPVWCDGTTEHRDTRKLAGRQLPLRGLSTESTGVTPTSPPVIHRGDTHGQLGVTPMSPKPSIEPSPPITQVPELQDTRACAECSQPADRCIPAQLKLRREDRHTFTPRPRP